MSRETASDWAGELATRRKRVWDITTHHDCQCLLVYGAFGYMEPFRYLANFAPVLGDAFLILRDAQAGHCILNFDWQLPEARSISGIERWEGVFDAAPRVAELLAADGLGCIGVVGSNRIPHTAFERIRSAIPGTTWIDLTEPVGRLRRVKSDLEVAMLREAGRITDAAVEDLRGFVRPGRTEFEIAARVANTMHTLGATLSFEPTVISGLDDPITIRMPTGRSVRAGDSIMIDVGACFQGYQADVARTFVLGEPNRLQAEVWDIVTASYAATLEEIRPGVKACRLHESGAGVIEAAGYELVHRIGHGIGLATSFEWPSLDTEEAPLEPGMTFCIEPGIYVPGAGNMKLEDDVLVTHDGFELLTHSSRELILPLDG